MDIFNIGYICIYQRRIHTKLRSIRDQDHGGYGRQHRERESYQ